MLTAKVEELTSKVAALTSKDTALTSNVATLNSNVASLTSKVDEEFKYGTFGMACRNCYAVVVPSHTISFISSHD